MNNINSVIIEGQIVKINKDSCILEVSRYYREYDEIKLECFKIEIIAYGKNLENMMRYAQINRGLRVVGRLVNQGEKTVVLAEHIEFKSNGEERKNEN